MYVGESYRRRRRHATAWTEVHLLQSLRLATPDRRERHGGVYEAP